LLVARDSFLAGASVAGDRSAAGALPRRRQMGVNPISSSINSRRVFTIEK
jgi:hypothetical protein